MPTDALVYSALISFVVGIAAHQYRRRLGIDAAARRMLAEQEILQLEPPAQHPYIELDHCIGCGSCVDACPESVLALLDGKALLLNPHSCVGHGFCAPACPTNAIQIVGPTAKVAAQLPAVTEEYETNIPGLYVVGELGGLGLIAVAVNQGVDCIDLITDQLADDTTPWASDVLDVCVVGAGPAGVSAALRAVQNELRCVLLERDRFGGTVEKYPRQKVVTTAPVVLPLVGWFKKTEISKEELISLWQKIATRAGFHVNENEEATSILCDQLGVFTIETAKHGNAHARYRARHVILAIGRRGTPRRLGVPGEALGKVMYSLLEAHRYQSKHILVVGGGQGAVETALALAIDDSNTVTLSYRGRAFKPARDPARQRNYTRIEARMREGKIRVLFDSVPVNFTPDSASLRVKGEPLTLRNDYVWICAGGETPAEFLTKIGVALRVVAPEEPLVRDPLAGLDEYHRLQPSLGFLVTMGTVLIGGLLIIFAL